MPKKPKLNLENLARLRKTIEKAGQRGFIMSELNKETKCGTACCFWGFLVKLGTTHGQYEEWLGVSLRTTSNLFFTVPKAYPHWTQKERFSWALRRLDELKKNGYLKKLPVNSFELLSGI